MLNPPLSLLSVELLEAIVELIAQDFDPAARDLKNLALAHRQFTSLCQQRIFAKFICEASEDTDWRQQLQSFLHLVATNQCVLGWVREVTLLVWRRIGDESWVFQDAAFGSILNQLSAKGRPPERLYIDSSGDQDVAFRNADVTLEILSHSIAPNLVNLTLSFCRGVPAQIFPLLPKLKQLRLDHAAPQLDRHSRMEGLRQGSHPSLEILKFRHSHDLIEKLLLDSVDELERRSVDFSNLREVEFPPSDETLPCLRRLLGIARVNLEELDITAAESPTRIEIIRPYTPITSYLDLGILRRLRSFRLRAPITYSDPLGDEVVADIADAFHAVPQSNNLRHIFLNFQILAGKEPFHQARGQEWERLGREIARIASERQLDIEMWLGVGGEDLWDFGNVEGRAVRADQS
ncbi:hypothetical protein BKA70DRAFT_1464404 [Coprinopsis sp. MPI-PUGE-AT-0042]|nr:hypothetical protein BKA70DRAFT_1464404 [Coprinopsis sp. MPI-PUGE-AT-0042]